MKIKQVSEGSVEIQVGRFRLWLHEGQFSGEPDALALVAPGVGEIALVDWYPLTDEGRESYAQPLAVNLVVQDPLREESLAYAHYGEDGQLSVHPEGGASLWRKDGRAQVIGPRWWEEVYLAYEALSEAKTSGEYAYA